MKLAIVTTYNNGDKIETVFFKKSTGVFQKIIINGSAANETKIYKVNTNEPFTRWAGRKWFITDEYLEALKTVV